MIKYVFQLLHFKIHGPLNFKQGLQFLQPEFLFFTFYIIALIFRFQKDIMGILYQNVFNKQ